MTNAFQTARKLGGERVRMRFDDGHEVVALLLSATTDMDGSQHLIYDAVEWTSEENTYGGGVGTCYYADGRTLESIKRAGDHSSLAPV